MMGIVDRVLAVVVGFVDTANQYPGSPERLKDYWSQAMALAREGAIPFDPEELGRYLEEMESQGFSPVRHSAAYRERYAPAYRVVLRALIEPSPVTATGQ